jgi:hypothetical protein
MLANLAIGPMAPPAPPPLPVLAPPVRLTAAGRPIQVDGGHADPWVCDVNGDGKKDLLVGQFRGGRLRMYVNVGSDTAPRFNGFSYVQSEGSDAAIRPS